jgi:hypothetical protein
MPPNPAQPEQYRHHDRSARKTNPTVPTAVGQALLRAGVDRRSFAPTVAPVDPVEQTAKRIKDFRKDLEFALDMIDSLQDHRGFTKDLIENADTNGNQPADDDPRYWQIFDGTVKRFLRPKPGNNLARRQIHLIQLMAAVPSGVYMSMKLSSKNSPLPPTDRREAVLETSRLNGLTREVLAGSPDVPIEYLAGAMVEAAEKLLDKRRFDAQIRLDVAKILHGARNEVAFEALLGSLNYEYRRATEDEDAKGIDYKIKIGKNWVPVDLKASRYELRSQDVDDSVNFLINEKNGVMTLYPGITEDHFMNGSVTFTPDAKTLLRQHLRVALLELGKSWNRSKEKGSLGSLSVQGYNPS